MNISPFAGKPAGPQQLTNIPRLLTAYYVNRPDPGVREQRVSFGTSGHRGSAFDTAFNEWHILAICQAICDYRTSKNINGPLFLGIDTHALSEPAFASTLEVLAANGVNVCGIASRATPPPPPFPTPFSLTTGGAKAVSPTASSSPRPTIPPPTAATSTTRPTAARPTPTSPPGLNSGQRLPGE